MLDEARHHIAACDPGLTSLRGGEPRMVLDPRDQGFEPGAKGPLGTPRQFCDGGYNITSGGPNVPVAKLADYSGFGCAAQGHDVASEIVHCRGIARADIEDPSA